MEFKTFYKILYNRLSNGMSVPYFIHEMIAMITDVPEEEWGTPLDPSKKITNENTLRNISKRGLTKTLAKNIVHRLKPENFIESINSREDPIKELLVEDFKPYDSTANKDNIAKLLADCYIEIIRTSAGIVESSTLEKQKREELARKLKDRYGDYLLNEVNNTCPYPGCGRSLVKTDKGKIITSYEVALIDKNKEPKIDNLIALCPLCYATYSIDSNKKIVREISSTKRILVGHNQSVALLDDLSLERGIVGVLKKIKKLKQKDLYDSSFEPKEIIKKVNPDEDFILYTTINNYVNTYFLRIKEIMEIADKQGEIDFEEVQHQIHSMYKKLNKAKKTKVEIFSEISQKIHKVSLMEDVYCQIVVAYFVQICEVYDATTE